VASAPLGDRVQLNSVEIDNNQIIVDMVNQGPDDAMCCPTQQVVQTYTLQGEELVQTSSETAGSGSAEEQSLVGPVWHWLQFVDPLSKTTVDDPSQYTVEFKPDGKVQVKADCNSGNGTYTAEGSSISIEVLAMTRAMCPPESLSDQFVQNLNEAAIYFFEGEDLFLDLPADSGTMRFAPAQ
jgi:para-nitrobenzyl esterase